MIYLTPYAKAIANELTDLNSGVGLLITPDSHRPNQYDVADFPIWAADNACFTKGDSFDLDAYLAWLDGFTPAQKRNALFATAPDVVGDWPATLERSLPTLEQIRSCGFPAVIVAQNGATPASMPWDQIDGIFIGGDTDWKLGPDAAAIAAAAGARGLWAHMGRVNSIKRALLAADAGCYSVDGTWLTFGANANRPRMLQAIARCVAEYGPVEVPVDWNGYVMKAA